MSGPAERPLTIGDLLQIVVRHRWLALGCGLSVATLVVLVTFRMTPLYEASATLRVEPAGKTLNFQVDPSSGRIEFSLLNTIRDMLQARPVLEAALLATGRIEQPPYLGARDPLATLAGRLRIQTSRDSLSVQVRVRDEDAGRGRDLLRALLDAFHDTQIAAHGSRATSVLDFLGRSRSEAEQRLLRLQEQDRALRAEHNLIDDDPKDNLLAQRLRQLNQQDAVLQHQMASSGATRDIINRAMAAEDPQSALLGIEQIARHPVVVQQREQLFALEQQRVLLGQKYGPRHPRMIEIEEQLSSKQRHLTEAIAMARTGVETRHYELGLQRAELDRLIQKTQDELEIYRGHLVELHLLRKELETTEGIVDSLRERLAEQRVLAELEATQVSVIDPPRAGSEAVNIKKPLFLAAALMAGAMAAIAATLALEFLDRRIRDPGRAVELGRLPVLVELPKVEDLPMVLGDGIEPPTLVEGLRSLCATLRLAHGERQTAVLVISSPCQADGKSTIAVRLAANLAATGRRVLLVDADLRKPSLDTLLGCETADGLGASLIGERVAPVVLGHLDDLHYLGAGPRPPNAAELLHADILPRLLRPADGPGYEWVIIDTPPLARVADALIVAQHADQVLLVVREGHSLKSDLLRCLHTLSPVAERILGFIYNGKRDQGGGYGYDYAYGFGAEHSALRSAVRRAVAAAPPDSASRKPAQQ